MKATWKLDVDSNRPNSDECVDHIDENMYDDVTSDIIKIDRVPDCKTASLSLQRQNCSFLLYCQASLLFPPPRHQKKKCGRYLVPQPVPYRA